VIHAVGARWAKDMHVACICSVLICVTFVICVDSADVTDALEQRAACL